MNTEFKKILAVLFLIFAGVLIWQSDMVYTEASAIKEDIVKYQKENEDMGVLREKISSAISIAQKNKDASEKFNFILPEKDNNPNLISAIENTASLNGIIISKIGFSEEKKIEPFVANDGTLVVPEQKKYNEQDISISFQSTYSIFKSFLTSIEKSLRLLDVTAVTFSLDETNNSGKEKNENNAIVYSFDLVMKAYWQPVELQGETDSLLNNFKVSDFVFTSKEQFNSLVFSDKYNLTINSDELNNPSPF